MGLANCFRAFDAKGANPRWSWSARSMDGKTIVLTLWKDGLKLKDGVITYDSFDLEGSGEWVHLAGNKERIENLKWARDHCGGLFKVVVTIAKDVSTVPRSIAECYAKPDWTMRLTELNEVTGEFRATSAL